MPKVSVIIPTFDRVQLLKRAIGSVLLQTFSDYEILVIQNGDLPCAKSSVRMLCADHEAIRHISVKEQDPTQARNIGLQNAKGEYVAFLDDDDEWYPEKLERQVFLLDTHPEFGWVSCKAIIVSSQEQAKGCGESRDYRDTFLELLRKGNTIHSLSLPMIRKTCFSRTGPFDVKYKTASDYDMYLHLAQHYQYVTIPEVLAKYHLHGGNLSRESDRMWLERAQIVKQFLWKTGDGTIREAIRENFREIAGVFHLKAVGHMDSKRYREALRCYALALFYDPFIGTRITWGRFSNPVYKTARPYLAMIVSGVMSLGAAIKWQR